MSHRYSSFIQEVSRCDYNPTQNSSLNKFVYNGVRYIEGVETYHRVLSALFNDFKAYLIERNNDKVLNTICTELNEMLQYNIWDAPTYETIDRMRIDYSQSHNESLGQSIKEAVFVQQMVNVQKSYIQQAIKYIDTLWGIETSEPLQSNIEKKEQKQEQNETPVPPQRFIDGIDGLCEYLHIGRTKATELSTSALFQEHRITKSIGKKKRYDKKILDELLKQNPDILSGKLEKRNY